MKKQRKLTWIEKKQIERIAFDHPFFDMHGTVLSKKEAKAIIRSAEARKSGVEIVSEACDKIGIPRPDSVDNRSSIFDNFKEIFSIPVVRRIGIIAIALILLIVFFAVTPTGRAIAESVIQYIATLFDDGRLVVNQSYNEAPLFLTDKENEMSTGEQDVSDDTASYVYLDSFDDFTEVTGKTPIVLPLPCAELYYEYDKTLDYIALYSFYETVDGQIIAYQIWDTESMVSSTLAGYSMYDANERIYYSLEENGDIYCLKIMEDSIYTIISKGNYSLESLVNMLKD